VLRVCVLWTVLWSVVPRDERSFGPCKGTVTSKIRTVVSLNLSVHRLCRDFEMHFVVVVETREVREEVEVVETVEADLHVLRPVEMMENVEAVVVVVEVVVRRAT